MGSDRLQSLPGTGNGVSDKTTKIWYRIQTVQIQVCFMLGKQQNWRVKSPLSMDRGPDPNWALRTCKLSSQDKALGRVAMCLPYGLCNLSKFRYRDSKASCPVTSRGSPVCCVGETYV